MGNFDSIVQTSRAFRLEGPEYGAAGRIRTHDPLVRSQVLYPTELQPLKKNNYNMKFLWCASAVKQNFAAAWVHATPTLSFQQKNVGVCRPIHRRSELRCGQSCRWLPGGGRHQPGTVQTRG